MLRAFFFIFSIGAWLLFANSSLMAQNQAIEEELPTRKVDSKVKEDTRKNRPDDLDVDYIYVEDGSKLLYGNRCALEATHHMGFEYVLEHRPGQPAITAWMRVSNNFWVKTKLCITKGPWWKLTLNNRLKQCARLGGDSRG